MNPIPEPEGHTYFIGDSDLPLLGVAAALAARWQMIRKGGTVPLPGFPQDDEHAKGLLIAGILAGMSVPLDDVPDLHVELFMDDDRVLDQLRALAASIADEESDA